MRPLSLFVLSVALLVTGCRKSGPTESVKTETPKTHQDVMQNVNTPSQGKMNFLVGKNIIRSQWTPAQLPEGCSNISDIRTYTKSCRAAVNRLAKSSTYETGDCRAGNIVNKGVALGQRPMICDGRIDTPIGSGNVQATFIQVKDVWRLQKTNLLPNTWVSN